MYGDDLRSLDDIVGNKDSIVKMRMFASDVDRGIKRPPLLMHGPSGIGKSTAAHLLAMERGWNVVELNASDDRDKESIDRTLLSAATSKSLFGKRNMVLLDEVDEMATYLDRGSSSAISGLMEVAKNPIVMIANDRWDQRISFLREKVEPVEFKRLRIDEIQKVLEIFSARLSLNSAKPQMQLISERANGDARSAINDLYVASGCGSEITDVLGMRDRKIDIFNMLDKIFFANSLSAPLRAIGNTDLQNDMLMRWLDENIPNRYVDMEDLSRAFNYLAEASSYATKAMRSQYYTYWRYMKTFMSSGIALSKGRYPSTAKRYSFPKVVKDLSASKLTRRRGAKIAEKMQSRMHSSIKKIMNGEMKILDIMIRQSLGSGTPKTEIVDYLVRSYGLEEADAKTMVGG